MLLFMQELNRYGVVSDSARYKALGNGMAQPCADFVIKRIKEVMSIDLGIKEIYM